MIRKFADWWVDMVSLPVSAVLITREPVYPRDININVNFDEYLVETNCKNLARRFKLAAKARNEIVYVQDDDAQIDIEALWRHYDGRLTHAITPGHFRIYNDLCQNRVTLIGWGCFFPKALLTTAGHDLSRFGDHEVDRVFTHQAFRVAGPHNTIKMPIVQITRARAMSRDNPDHYRSRDFVIRQLDQELV
jgi:hypothetical protein